MTVKPGILVPQRLVPPPCTVSAQAQAFLSRPLDMAGVQPQPDDKAGWEAYASASLAQMLQAFSRFAEIFPAEISPRQVGEATLYEIVPQQLDSTLAAKCVLYVHGGAFVTGGGLAAAYVSLPLAGALGVRVFSTDYRMPPNDPFPAGLNDVVDAYRTVVEQYGAENVVVVGASAGGNLAAAGLLKARELGLPMCAGCVLISPEADLTESGDSFETNYLVDVVLKERLTHSILLYANGHDLKDPLLSPIFADFSLGFPPTLITSGTRDLFLSNAAILHRAMLKGGISTELHVFEAMPHGGFFGAPEDLECEQQQYAFIKKSFEK